MASSTLGRFLEEEKDKNMATLSQNMYGYVIPVFVDIIFVLAWIMIAVKAMSGSGLSGVTRDKGNTWCGCFCMVLCVFQSFFGFCVVHTIVQPWSLVLMLIPALGFMGFSTNNRVWLFSFARIHTI